MRASLRDTAMLFGANPRMEVHGAKLASYAEPGNRRSCRGMPINITISADQGGRHSAGERAEPHTGNSQRRLISADAARPDDVAMSFDRHHHLAGADALSVDAEPESVTDGSQEDHAPARGGLSHRYARNENWPKRSRRS